MTDQSPDPFSKAEVLVDFPTAIAAVIDGKRITKVEWNNPKHYAMLRDGFLMLYRDDAWFTWTLSDGDLLGQDWIVL